MATQTAGQLRDLFLKFFDRRGHTIRASTAIVPKGDPTLLFNSAGMVPFKPYFLGLKTGLSRAASCQKCFRTTDIDRVGTTIRHLTFFEMLGNFSFGDYFKADAIHWAWEFLAKEAGLDPKRLYPTIFKDDEEAMGLWKKENTPNATIRLGEETNFWNMGPTGPCGPCSEIYYDMGPSLSCGKPDCAPGCDCDRYIEIWNLVFTQFDRQPDNSLNPLPKKNIDTGMGLERLALAVQGKKSPFETDLFWPIMEKAAGIIGKLPGSSPETKMAFRIIGDHTRAASVLASEGIIPSNVERGYVLRRLIRRAVRYGQLLGHKKPFLHSLVPSVIETLGSAYPEIAKTRSQIEQTLKAEEERFLDTLDRGERELDEILASKPKALSGEQAFKLYDTFGFPFELTKEICAQRGVPVEEAGFAEAQKKAAEIARAGWKGSGEVPKTYYAAITSEFPQLRVEFRGYQSLNLDTIIEVVIGPNMGGLAGAVSYSNDPKYGELRAGDKGEVILRQTPFYPEGGGQIGDAGWLLDDTGKKIAEVHDTQKPNPNLITHIVTAIGTITPRMKVKAQVDAERRRRTMYHHTATHLLNAALRHLFGTSVRQAGSLVDPDHLRFDFTYPRAMTDQEIVKVEASVNGAIQSDYPVEPEEHPAAEVEKLGAVTLLGEDYGQNPRFLLIGPQGWKAPMERYSLELCGGTHVHHTGEIGRFKIVKESSVAAGIRRIDAVAGPALEELEREQENETREALKLAVQRFVRLSSEIRGYTGKPYHAVPIKLADFEKSPIEDVRQSLQILKESEKAIKTTLASLKENAASKQAASGKIVREIGGVKLCAQKLKDAAPASLRNIADQIKQELVSGVAFIGSGAEGKLSFVVVVTKDLVAKGVDASALAKEAAALIGGKAGGRSDFAQGGGPDGNWEELVRKVGKAIHTDFK